MVLDVLQSLFTPTNLAFLVGGVIIGIIFGAIPGLGANTAITLLPVSFAMNATTAIIFMASIYCGGVSGGLISAILLGIPGTNANLATVYDGYRRPSTCWWTLFTDLALILAGLRSCC